MRVIKQSIVESALALWKNSYHDSSFFISLVQGSHSFETVLFVPETDETNLVWHGPGSGTAAAVDVFRADKALKSAELRKFLSMFVPDRCFYIHNRLASRVSED